MPAIPAKAATDALSFHHRGSTHSVSRGGLYAASVGETYRDAPESEVRNLIESIGAGHPWRDAVAAAYAEKSPWLHRIVTDRSRDLFFRMHPPARDARILDIGAGWGQIALPLAHNGFVCALEPTPERLHFVRAAAVQERLAERMWFLQADFLEIEFFEPFDLVTCIGVLEWIPRFAPDAAPLDAQRRFLERARHCLAPGGRLVIGIENRLGLKYLLGAPDDHVGLPGIAVYDAVLADRKHQAACGAPMRALTHTRAEYEELLLTAGFGRVSFWASFPDYKIPSAIVPRGPETDAFLATQFVPEHDGIRGDPLGFQDELRSHYQSLARLGIASDFAPSFYISAQVA